MKQVSLKGGRRGGRREAILIECSSTDSQKSLTLQGRSQKPLFPLLKNSPPDLRSLEKKKGLRVAEINDRVPATSSALVDENREADLVFSFKIGPFNQIRIRADPRRSRKIAKRSQKDQSQSSKPQPFFRTPQPPNPSTPQPSNPSPLLIESFEDMVELEQSEISICFPKFEEDL